MEETEEQVATCRQVGSRDLREQIDQAASELQAGLASNDLSAFYDWFRASDLPFVALAQREDPVGLARTCCRILHRLGGISPAVAMALENHFYVTSALVTFPVGDPALEERREQLLEDLERRRLLVANTNPRVQGNKLGAFGMTARRDGEGFRVRGSAAYMSLASQGDLLVFLCMIEDEGPAIFVTPLRGNAEVEVGPLLFARTMVDSDTRRVTFHDLALAKSDLLMSGQTEQMAQLISFELAWHQLLISVLYVGAAARAIEEVRLFLRSVEGTTDRPLAELDGMVVDTGRLVLRYRTIWGMVEKAAEALGRISRYPLATQDLDRVLDIASTAKYTGTIGAEEIVTAARRIVGARSFVDGHPLERLSLETPLGPLGPELNAAIERRLGRHALGEMSFLVCDEQAGAGA
jgi:alkylation response protein AidB-like acyl-CoA dehydrogenase